MLKMNLLTVKTGEAAYAPTIIKEIEFWEHYLNLLNIRQTTNTLSNKEIRVLSYILAGDPNKSYFKGPEALELKAALRMKKSDLSKIKSILILKGYVVDTGATRGDALPTRAIRSFQKYVKEQLAKNKLPTINFMFTFNIENDNRETESNN